MPAAALTIAGSDSGGGAGIQGDLKTFEAAGIFGTSVVTAITCQNTERISKVFAVPPEVVAEQLTVVLDDIPIGAAKTGMLQSAETVNAICDIWDHHAKGIPLVVDPVLRSTGGTPLIETGAMGSLFLLMQRAVLVTPNLPELEMLLEETIDTAEAIRDGAKALFDRTGAAILVKGGHAPNRERVTDLLYDGSEFMPFSHPFRHGVQLHGTGCALSAAITASLAKQESLTESVRLSVDSVSRAIAGAFPIGSGALALDHRSFAS